VQFAGAIEVDLSGPLVISFLIGAEDAPTTQFWSGVSPAYLVGLGRDFQKEPLTLVAQSPEEEFNQDATDRLFRQLGLDPEFLKAMQKVMSATDPEIPQKSDCRIRGVRQEIWLTSLPLRTLGKCIASLAWSVENRYSETLQKTISCRIPPRKPILSEP
jgi:hypothetical protein